MSENKCGSTLRGFMGTWAGETCGRPSVPGFSECWRHADVEKMAAKIVDLTGQIGALKQEHEEDQGVIRVWRKRCEKAQETADAWRMAWEAKEAVLQTETKRRVSAEEALADLQRSIASALFGAARDDDRVSPAKITGAMIDALAPYLQAGGGEHGLMSDAEAFLAGEDRRGK